MVSNISPGLMPETNRDQLSTSAISQHIMSFIIKKMFVISLNLPQNTDFLRYEQITWLLRNDTLCLNTAC